MRFLVEANGNVTFFGDESQEALKDLLERHKGDDVSFLSDMLELGGYSTNGGFTPIRPENVGALTDAPMFAENVDIADNGDVEVSGKVWWYPDYQILNFAAELVSKGKVTFTAASY